MGLPKQPRGRSRHSGLRCRREGLWADTRKDWAVVTIGRDGCAEFRFFRPRAANVFVCGDFNEWRADQLRMVRGADGYWVLKLRLPAGEYRFRYVADGVWYTDFAAFGVEPGRFGLNSILLVPAWTLQLPRRQPARPAAAAAAAAAA